MVCWKILQDIVLLPHYAALSYCDALQPEFCQRGKNISFDPSVACKEASASPDPAQPKKHKKLPLQKKLNSTKQQAWNAKSEM